MSKSYSHITILNSSYPRLIHRITVFNSICSLPYFVVETAILLIFYRNLWHILINLHITIMLQIIHFSYVTDVLACFSFYLIILHVL